MGKRSKSDTVTVDEAQNLVLGPPGLLQTPTHSRLPHGGVCCPSGHADSPNKEMRGNRYFQNLAYGQKLNIYIILLHKT